LVLFLCRTNTALSIMAEAVLRHSARERVRAVSAGEFPAAQVHPYALECLRARRIGTTGLRSKGCDDILGAYRIPVKYLIILSDVEGAGTKWETVRPTKAHWGMPDPSAVVGSEIDIRVAFEEAFLTLEARIREFLALPFESLDGRSLTLELERIGRVLGG
jgi:arsenate reductase